MADCGHSHGSGDAHGHSHGAAEPVATPQLDDAAAAAASAPVEHLHPHEVRGESLAHEFLRAQALYAHIVGDSASALAVEPYPCVEHDESSHVFDALRMFTTCAVLVRTEGVFSDNETLRDMLTESLQFLLIEYYIGSLLQRLSDDRVRRLRAAGTSLEAFLHTILRVRAFDERDSDAIGIPQVLSKLSTDEDDDSVASDSRRRPAAAASASSALASRDGDVLGGAAVPPALMGAAASRNAKIERFKRNTVAKKRLAELAAMNARAHRALRRDADVHDDGVGAHVAGPVGDAETRREALILTLECAARSAVDDLLTIQQELPLAARLAAARAREGPEDDRAPRRGPPADDPSIDPTRKGIEVVRIAPTFEVTRETVRADVFKLGHRPPTMSMEDWGDIVTQKRIAREARERKQTEGRTRTLNELVETGQEDDEAAYEAAVERERRMDDWKDGVPKGAGNTKRV